MMTWKKSAFWEKVDLLEKVRLFRVGSIDKINLGVKIYPHEKVFQMAMGEAKKIFQVALVSISLQLRLNALKSSKK